MRIPSSRRAFTLIELLVVIAIIGVLAGMLMPVIANLKATALAMECSSRQRQTGLAMVAFAVDNRGWLPFREGIDCYNSTAAAAVHASYRTPIVALYQGDYLPMNDAVGFEPGWPCSGGHGWSSWSNRVVMRSFRNPSACPGKRPVDPVTGPIATKEWFFQMRWFTDLAKAPAAAEQWSAKGGGMRLTNANQAVPLLGDAMRTDHPGAGGGYWWNWSPVPGEHSTPPNSTNFLLRNHRDRAVVTFPDGRTATLDRAGLKANNILYSTPQP